MVTCGVTLEHVNPATAEERSQEPGARILNWVDLAPGFWLLLLYLLAAEGLDDVLARGAAGRPKAA
jgi:hypothetical protein